MKACILALISMSLPVVAETLTFKPGELSTTVKGALVADQTREYIFAGKAGQRYDFQVSSQRGQWLVLHLRQGKREMWTNFQSGHLKGKGVLPETGDYTLYLGLRRPEVQREGRVDYTLTVTVQDPEQPFLLENGRGELFSSGRETRILEACSVKLAEDGRAEIRAYAGAEELVFRGSWKKHGDEAALLQVEEAFGRPASGQGAVLFDDDRDDRGRPDQLFLQVEEASPGQRHTLVFGRR